MKKVITGLALLLGLCAIALFTVPSEVMNGAKGINKEIKEHLVYVRGIAHAGSGVIISSNEFGSLILTNKHVCEPNKLSEDFKDLLQGIPSYLPLVTFKKGVAFAQIMKVSVNSDLCLLHTKQINLKAAKIADEPVVSGEDLFTCGNPHNVLNLCYTGTASSYNYLLFMLFQLTSIPARPGQSGSGVFNSDVELVGLISLGATDASFSAIVPLSHIRLFLSGIEL